MASDNHHLQFLFALASDRFEWLHTSSHTTALSVWALCSLGSGVKMVVWEEGRKTAITMDSLNFDHISQIGRLTPATNPAGKSHRRGGERSAAKLSRAAFSKVCAHSDPMGPCEMADPDSGGLGQRPAALLPNSQGPTPGCDYELITFPPGNS